MPSQGTEPRPAGARLTSMRHVCHRQSCSKAPEMKEVGPAGWDPPSRSGPARGRTQKGEQRGGDHRASACGDNKGKDRWGGRGLRAWLALEGPRGPLEAQEPWEGLQVESGVIQPAPLWIPAPHGYHFGCCAEDARGQVGTGHR